MTGLDTNVLLRFPLNDDEAQASIARRFIEARSANDPAFVSLIVLVEAIWTLRRVYKLAEAEISSTVCKLLDADSFVFEEAAFVHGLFERKRDIRGDIADHLIAFAASKAGCTTVVTFDRRAERFVPGMTLLA